MGLIVLLFTICCLLCLLIHYFCSEKVHALSLKIFSKIYNGLLFPCALGFLFPYFLEKATLSARGNSKESILFEDMLSLLSLAILAFVSVILSQEFRNLFIPRRLINQLFDFSLAAKAYIPIYQFFSFIFLAALWAWIRFGMDFCLFILFGITTFILILQIWTQPYLKMFDNVSICFNSALLIIFFIFFFLRNWNIIHTNTQLDIIFCLIIFALISLCIVCSFIRVFKSIFCQSGKKLQVEKKGKIAAV